MKPLRQLLARKAWARRRALGVERPRGSFVWGQGARVLLLLDLDDPPAVTDARAFAEAQRNRGASVRELGYSAVDLPKEQRSPERWGPASLTFARLPSAAAEEPYRGRDYDLVVHCGLAPFEPFDYLVAGLRAHRRVAAYDSALEAYDLVVTPPAVGAVAAFLREVERLLGLLNPDYAD